MTGRFIPLRIRRVLVPASVVLGLASTLAGCQRPTEGLPPAPVFVLDQEPVPTPPPQAWRAPTRVAEVPPVTDDSFLRYSGSDTVLFGEGSADLDSDAKAILLRQAEWLARHDKVRFVLEGHCDDRTTRGQAFALGNARAQAMRRFMQAQGIDDDRIVVLSLGRELPVLAGTLEESRRMSRRGVTRLLPNTDADQNSGIFRGE